MVGAWLGEQRAARGGARLPAQCGTGGRAVEARKRAGGVAHGGRRAFLMPDRREGVVLEWKPRADLGRIQTPDGRVIGMTRAGLAAPPEVFAVGTRVTFVLKRGVWGWSARDVRPVPAATPEAAS